jgi:preprotein translocase subunit SecG
MPRKTDNEPIDHAIADARMALAGLCFEAAFIGATLVNNPLTRTIAIVIIVHTAIALMCRIIIR